MHTKIFQKATRLIDCIANSSTQSLSLEQAHLITNFPKSTIKRILDDFVELGWLYRRLGDKQYVILYIPASKGASKYILAKACSEILTSLYSKTRMPSDFVIVENGRPTVLESSFSLSGLRTVQTRIIGLGVSPLTSAAGRTLLSERNDIKINKEESNVTHSEFFKKLNQEKRSGLYKRIPETWEHEFKAPFELEAVALPIRYHKKTLAAINMYWYKDRDTDLLSLPGNIEHLHLARTEMEQLISSNAQDHLDIISKL